MKVLIMILVSTLPALASSPVCPGRCVNVDGNPDHKIWCDNFSFNEQACRNISGAAGCAWFPGRPVEYPGRCVNVGGNPDHDIWCNNASSSEAVCRNFANAGCAWMPGQQFCQ
jgi:hypothetical protein